MLYDSLTIQEVVDSESAAEFLKEATKLASSKELEDIAKKLSTKQQYFKKTLGQNNLNTIDERELEHLLRRVFSISRKSPKIIRMIGFENLCNSINELLYGEYGELESGKRITIFTKSVSNVLDERRAINLASELLHYSDPEKYALWTNWIWDPITGSGALQMVLQEEMWIQGDTISDRYDSISSALKIIEHAGYSKSISGNASGMLGCSLYLACVHSVYMYTVFRMKMSNEFNRILPELPEMVERLLGVRKMEVDQYV